MRLIALAVTVPPLLAALLVAALIATAMPSRAAQPASDRATLIEECMREIRAATKAGQKLTNGQRMLAEEQCRARAEAAMQTQAAAPRR